MTPALSLFTTSIKSSFTWIAVLTFITISTWSCDLIDEKTATIFLCFISGALIASINLSFNAKFSSLIQSPIMAIAVLIALISSWVYSPSSYTFIVIPALALILLAVTNNNSFIGLLKIKPFKLAGKVSYSIYILHGLCLNFVIGFLFTKSTYEFTFAASAFFVMMLSTLNYFYVEKRFMGKMKDTEHPIYVK
jgi:peptidoglycan/LPS O-acetylase OafA/YrhL